MNLCEQVNLLHELATWTVHHNAEIYRAALSPAAAAPAAEAAATSAGAAAGAAVAGPRWWETARRQPKERKTSRRSLNPWFFKIPGFGGSSPEPNPPPEGGESEAPRGVEGSSEGTSPWVLSSPPTAHEPEDAAVSAAEGAPQYLAASAAPPADGGSEAAPPPATGGWGLHGLMSEVWRRVGLPPPGNGF